MRPGAVVVESRVNLRFCIWLIQPYSHEKTIHVKPDLGVGADGWGFGASAFGLGQQR